METVSSQPALVYFDANAFMYGFEGDPPTRAPIRRLVDALRHQPRAGVTSEFVLAELLAPVANPAALPAAARRRMYMALLLGTRTFDLRPVTRSVLLGTSRLREQASLKLPDAIHMVTAIEAGCRFVLSADPHFDRGPVGLKRVEPNQTGVDLLLSELP